MTIYTAAITASAKSTQEHTMLLEGYAITHVSILFPSGCLGLVSVKIYYGLKQIFPYDEEQSIIGNGETVQWAEHWILPEERTNITIKVINDDDTYQHTIYVRLIVTKKSEMLASQLANAMLSALKRIFGFVST